MKKQTAWAICLVLLTAPVLFYSFIKKNGNGKIADTIRTDAGLVSGIKSNGSNVVAFKGIPFAAPPVGPLRWKAPQPAKPWAGVKKCNAFGPSPMQPVPRAFMVYTPEFLIPETPISEDCLYLNVWTKAASNAKKPVLVWIYGGGFSSGGAAVPIYDGEALAKKGVVVVVINYRVGVFGFLAHPELTRESPNHASGNYGLMDQIAALKWVKKNIVAFGGDPDNVTIDGQSAGSMSVNCLVASPAAKGLFNKAIAESGSMLINNGAFGMPDLATAEQNGVKLAEAAHAATLADLRNMSAADLLKVPGRSVPIVDGYVLPQPVPQIFAEGKENKVPVITGWNADDALVGSFKSAADFKQQAKDQYGADADEFLKYYPASTDAEAVRSQINISRDMTFGLSGYKWANVQSEEHGSPIYLYRFNHRLPATPDYEKYGAFHTGEVAYALDNLKFLNRPWKADDQPLANLMSNYWVNFITTGNPNGKGQPTWPKYNTKTNEIMVFDSKSGSKPLPDKGELDFMLKRLEK